MVTGSRAKRDSSGLYHAQQDQDFLSSLSSPDADTYVAPITNYGIPSKRFVYILLLIFYLFLNDTN